MCATHTIDPAPALETPAVAIAAAPAGPWRTFRLKHLADRIATAGGLRSLIVQVDDRLYEIAEAAVEALAPSEVLDFDAAPGCRRLAEGIEGEWRIEPRSATLLIVRRGGIERLSLRNPAAFQRIATPALPGRLVDVRATPDNARLLCITRDESDADLMRYFVHLVDAEHRKLIAGEVLRSSLPLRGTWSPDAAAFIVFDPCSERLWRIGRDGPSAEAVEIPMAEGRAVRGFYAHPADRWFAIELQDQSEGTALLQHGWWSPDGPQWDKQNLIDGAGFDCPRWRPTEREMVCVRQEKRRVRLELLNAFGAAPLRCDVPRGWCITDAAWSGDAQRVYVLADSLLGRWNVPQLT